MKQHTTYSFNLLKNHLKQARLNGIPYGSYLEQCFGLEKVSQ